MSSLKDIMKDLEKPISERIPLEIRVDRAETEIEEEKNSTIRPLKSKDDFERMIMVERGRWVQVVNLLICAYKQKVDLRDQAKANFRIDGENFVCHRGNVFLQDQLVTPEEIINVTIKGKNLDQFYADIAKYFSLEECGSLADLRNALVSMRSYHRRLESQFEKFSLNVAEHQQRMFALESWKNNNRQLFIQFIKNLSWKARIATVMTIVIFIYSYIANWK